MRHAIWTIAMLAVLQGCAAVVVPVPLGTTTTSTTTVIEEERRP
jgi:hypothetical protein